MHLLLLLLLLLRQHLRLLWEVWGRATTPIVHS